MDWEMVLTVAGFILAALAVALAWSARRLWQKLLREARLSQLSDSQKFQQEVKKVLERQGRDGQNHFQKVGIIRFNPFADSGSDQSFALAVLNGHNSGFVVSSLHSRSETRIYLKPVTNGRGRDFPLSKEEEQAIMMAK